jgi:hypothetical protein
MTDALTRLADAVEAGAGYYEILSAATEWDSDNGNGLSESVVNAYYGSLDAAKALHEAVLPDWHWDVASSDAAAVFHGSALSGPCELAAASNPARAWLLAIIRALAQASQLPEAAQVTGDDWGRMS